MFDKREMKLRNAAHPCNGLLGLFLTSEAIKNIFIEGKGETLKLSCEGAMADEVIKISTNMRVLYDASQNTADILLAHLITPGLGFKNLK